MSSAVDDGLSVAAIIARLIEKAINAGMMEYNDLMTEIAKRLDNPNNPSDKAADEARKHLPDES